MTMHSSIKTRIVGSVLVLFVTGLWALSMYIGHVAKEDMTKFIRQNQFQTASDLASDIATGLNERFEALSVIGASITPKIFYDRQALQSLMEQRPLVSMMFNGGVFVTDDKGLTVASVPPKAGRLGVTYIDREYIVKSLAGEDVVSRPVIGKKLHTPLIVLSVPLKHEDKVVGVFAGVVNLAFPNFLGALIEKPYGNTGGYRLVDSKYGVFVTATDTSKIMMEIPPEGTNLMQDKYMKGYEGSGTTVNSRGVEELSVAKQIPMAHWYVEVVLPTAEAFASAEERHYQLIVFTFAMSCLAGVLVWWVLRRQFKPITNAVKMLAEVPTTADPLEVRRDDEVGELIVGFNRLLKAIKENEAVLAKAENRYRVLFSRASDGIFIMSLDGMLVEVNQAFAEMHGYTIDELVCQKVTILNPKVDSEVMPKLLEGQTVVYEAEHLHKDGHWFPLEVSASLVHEDEIYIQCYNRDITQRRLDEAEHRKLEQQFHQAQKLESLGILAGGIAHDFNNILTVIIGHLQLLQLEPERLSSSLPLLSKASDRAAELCKQMLAYAGKAKVDKSQIHVVELVEEMVGMLRSTLKQNIEILFEHQEDMPPIYADASQIRQVVMNLVINASEAIGNVQGIIDIVLSVKKFGKKDVIKDHLDKYIAVGSYICIEVTDTGCGMDEDTKWRIFEPFFTTKLTGRGLGMAAVLGIINSNKGALQVYSQVGKGTTFRIYLPVNGADHSTAAVDVDSTWKGHGTILLVEDETDVVGIVTGMLKILGFDVVVAENGEDALEKYAEGRDKIDFVITDMGMPIMDGYTFIPLLREMNPEVPIIISSGFGDIIVTDQIDEEGIIGLLSKPYSFDQLSGLLQRVHVK